MKKRNMFAASALLVLALAVPAMAQPGPGCGPGPDGFLKNLPQDKQEVVQKTLETERANHFQLMQQIRVKRIQLEALNVDPKADQAAIDGLVNEINAMKGQMFKDRVATQRKIFLETGVLLPMGGPGQGGKGGHGMRGRK